MTARREYEQNEIVRTIIGDFHRAAPTEHRPLFVRLASRLARLLDPEARDDGSAGDAAASAVIDRATGLVEAFTPHPVEQRYLYGCLLEAVTRSLVARVYHEWQVHDLALDRKESLT